MQRALLKTLIDWKTQPNRSPLLLRGARQVGKSYLVEVFGKTNFDNLITLNFEKQPMFRQVFTTFDIPRICQTIEMMTQQNINPGKTLLFLDEIQECPQAIQTLRYFKEDKPDLHVIAAGSLLEFVLNDADFRMPVGRVQNYFLKPLSFKEFLIASGLDQIVKYLTEVTIERPPEPIIHDKLLQHLREYLFLGGMPAVLQQYFDTKNFNLCQEVQANLMTTYRNDFGKYANIAKHQYLQAVFERAPGMVGKHCKYVDIDPHMLSRDLKQSIQILSKAGLIYQIFASKANALPLNASINEKKFKLLFLDVGLVQCASHLSGDLLTSPDFITVNRGNIVEQFVGQELLTVAPPYAIPELFYWERAQPGSTSEVDYVTHVDAAILGVEVKSGVTGRLKSLRIFMEEKQSSLGIRISQHSLSFENRILSVPLYMIHELPRLCKTL